MYKIDPPAVFAHEDVMENPLYRPRVERVVENLEKPKKIETFTDRQLAGLASKRGLLEKRVPMGTLPETKDPFLLFNTFKFASEDRAWEMYKKAAGSGINIIPELYGLNAFRWAGYNLAEDQSRDYRVCRPCWRIHMQQGCLHRCLYCGAGGLLLSMVNVEEYCDYLSRIIKLHPWQKTYLLDDDADPPGLEPELGCLGELIEYFGALREERYLIIHTKTWNTEWMLWR